MSMPSDRTKSVETREIEWFAQYYGEGLYNPTGWLLRMEREIATFFRVTGQKQFGRLLSVGCGDGVFEVLLAPHAKEIVALDISAEAIAVARENATRAGVSNVDFRCISVTELPQDQTYDCVICLSFLHHLQGPALQELLRKTYQVLKPDGFFFSVDPHRHGILRKIGRVVLGRQYHQYHTPDEIEMDPQEFTKALAQAGFKSIKIGFTHLTLLPALYILAKWPGWLMYPFYWLDGIFCASPFAPWASEFTVIAWKHNASPPKQEARL